MTTISSFDPYVLQDELLKIMKNSPETQQFLQMRVTQLVSEIMQNPLVQNLKKQISMLKNALEKSEQDYNQLLQELKDENEKLSQQLQDSVKNGQKLEEELEEKMHIQKQNTQLNEKVRKLTIVNESLEKSIFLYENSKKESEKTQGESIRNLSLQITQKDKKIELIQSELENLQHQFDELQKLKSSQEEKLIAKMQRLEEGKRQAKNQLNSSKSNEGKLKKEFEGAKKKNQILEKEFAKIQQNLKQQILLRENQRKVVNTKLKQVTKRSKLQQKGLQKIKNLLKDIRQVKDEVFALKKDANEFFVSLKEKIEKDYVSILDEIGFKMTKQLEDLMMKIHKQGTQLKLHKEQVKVKEEIILKLQKMTETQTSGNHELKQELKVKKRQADILRKQLKRNYQQTQIKLVSMEKAYKDILIESRSLRY